MSRVLLLLHPTVVTEPELVLRIKQELEVNEESVEQQIIDRVTKGHVELEKNAYSKIVYVNPNTDKSIPAAMMTLLHDSLTNDGVCSGDLPKDQNLDVLMSGFIVDEEKQVWIKPAPVETVSIPLKKKTEGTNALKKMPKFKKLETEDNETSKRTLQESKLAYFSQSDDSDNEDDDKEYGYGYNNSKIIDENDLIKDSKSTNLIIPKACELPNGKKRRKACKDCTCGLKELEENEDLQQRNLQNSILGQTVQSANLEAIKIEERLKKNQQSVKLTDEDLTEIDFTVEGKQGGCGSCALGDAFRCDGCPYLGLPPFQPGQAITIDSLGEDI